MIQLHLGLAAFTVPEMALDQDEAHQIAVALATLEKHYPINPLSEKHMALFAFASVIVRVYGRRVPAVIAGRSASRKASQASAQPPQATTAAQAVDNVQAVTPTANWMDAAMPAPGTSIS